MANETTRTLWWSLLGSTNALPLQGAGFGVLRSAFPGAGRATRPSEGASPERHRGRR
jgi:hypothetical protein